MEDDAKFCLKCYFDKNVNRSKDIKNILCNLLFGLIILYKRIHAASLPPSLELKYIKSV